MGDGDGGPQFDAWKNGSRGRGVVHIFVLPKLFLLPVANNLLLYFYMHL
jgi:hypothetical protein